METLCCTLAVNDAHFDIVIGVGDRDPISESIAEQTFTFPTSFQLPFALMQPGHVVLDLGAHVGTFTLAAAALGCRVVAVEASPYNTTLLNASVTKNGFDQVQIVSAAASDRPGNLDFVQAGPYGLVATPVVKSPTIQVPAVTVDELLAELGCDRVDLIKMDIEGSEVIAIRGMSRLLTRTDAPSVFYESNGYTLNFFGETPNTLTAALREFGYDSYLVEPGQLVPICANGLQAECTVDCLAVRQLPDTLKDWQVTAPMTFEETVSRVLSACAHPHEHHRAYTARALAGADPAILDNLKVKSALRSLNRDPNADVRLAASWWTETGPPGTALFTGAVADLRGTLERLLGHLGVGKHRPG